MAEQRSQPAGRSLDLGHDLGHCARLTPLAAGMLRPESLLLLAAGSFSEITQATLLGKVLGLPGSPGATQVLACGMDSLHPLMGCRHRAEETRLWAALAGASVSPFVHGDHIPPSQAGEGLGIW